MTGAQFSVKAECLVYGVGKEHLIIEQVRDICHQFLHDQHDQAPRKLNLKQQVHKGECLVYGAGKQHLIIEEQFSTLWPEA